MAELKITSYIPPLYSSLLPEFFDMPVEEETVADCSCCPMIAEPVEGVLDKDFFSPSSKCCTHYPEIPNFLLGGLLADPDPRLKDGVVRIEELIAARTNTTPRGLLRPARYELLLLNTEKAYFGRSQTLICPLFNRDSGDCTVWPYVSGTCNCWF